MGKISKFIYQWLPIIFGCHCIDERSFHMKRKRFPICARCTGELVGIIAGCITYWYFHLSVYWLILLMLPMVLDGAVQLLTAYESNNALRFVTGLGFGYALLQLFFKSVVFAFQFGGFLGR